MTMEQGDIKNKILDILEGLFADPGIDRDILEYVDLVDDLGMDSIIFISLVIEIEVAFDIKIPDEWLLIEKLQNYTLIFEAVETLLTRKETEIANG